MAFEKRIELFKKLFPLIKKDYASISFDYDKLLSDYLSIDEVISSWKSFVDKQDSNSKRINFYFHFPFCASVCKYCQYDHIQVLNQAQIDRYILFVKKYITHFEDVLKKIHFSNVYFGGGTPSLLTEEQLSDLFSFLNKKINFLSNEDNYFARTFEFNPASISKEKVILAKEFGFNRLSLGVQSFNKNTLALENRKYFSPERIKSIIDFSKKIGIEKIDVDMIIGLNKEGKEEILDSMNKLLQINPDSACLYILQSNIKSSSLYDGKEKFYENIINIGKEIKNLISNTEYTGDFSNHLRAFSIRKKKMTGFKFNYTLYPLGLDSIFAVGYNSIGRIHNQLIYQNCDFKKSFHSKGSKIDKKTGISLYILESLEKGTIDTNQFKEAFLLDFDDLFRKEISYLSEQDILIQEGSHNYIWNSSIPHDDRLIYSSLFYSKELIMKLMNSIRKEHPNIISKNIDERNS